MNIEEFKTHVRPKGKHSKLEPFKEQLLELKAKGYTNLQACEWLAANGVTVSQEGLRKFIINREGRLPKPDIPVLKTVGVGRPRSLQDAVTLGRKFGDTDSFIREFLDEFYIEQDRAQREFMLQGEPSVVAENRTNAYLAAVAEHLALRNHLPVPEWTGKPCRFLKHPFFPGGLESLKATFLVESPTAFRRRMIFVGSDPLYRPRRDTVGIGS